MLIILDNNTNPYYNLALEEYLVTSFKEPIFRLWQNDNAIIIGKHQNTWAEINYEFVKQNNISIVRRLSGGGAVYHDMGNINFTFIENISNNQDISFEQFTEPIINAINLLGVKAYLEGRNDLMIDGKKFSGNAKYKHNGRLLMHGTILFDSKIETLSNALQSKELKFEGKAVNSNISRVCNLSNYLTQKMTVQQFLEHITQYILSNNFASIYQLNKFDIEQINLLAENKYKLDSWNYAASPNFSHHKIAKTPKGLIEIHYEVDKSKIKDIKIFGDFFTNNNISQIETQFIGSQFQDPNQLINEINNLL